MSDIVFPCPLCIRGRQQQRHKLREKISDCFDDSSEGFIRFIGCVGGALAPGTPEYFRLAGGITEGMYTFSENTTMDADAGVSLAASMGFIFGEPSNSSDPPKWRSEIEIGYSLNPLNKTSETNAHGTITDRHADGTLRQLSTMLAVIYEIIPDCLITPYVKVGVGPTFLTISDVTVENRLVFKQQTKTFFAYQFGGGLKYTPDILEKKFGYRRRLSAHRHIDGRHCSNRK